MRLRIRLRLRKSSFRRLRKKILKDKKTLIIASFVFLSVILIAIFFAIGLVPQKAQVPEITLQEKLSGDGVSAGRANLLLSAFPSNIQVGQIFQVDASVVLTDENLRILKADFVLLYDKNKFEVIDLVPNTKTVYPDAPFDSAPVATYGDVFDETFNSLHIVEVALRSKDSLVGGRQNLAKITFRAKEQGQGVIKYPEDNRYLQIICLGPYLTPTPTIIPSPSPPPPWLKIPGLSFILDEYKKIMMVKLIEALERYYLSYNHFPSEGDPSDESTSWIRRLKDSGELSVTFEYFLSLWFKPVNCNSQSQKGFCYWSDGRDKAVVFVKMNYKPTQDKCETGIANFLWSSADQKIGIVCMIEDNRRLSGFTFL